MTANQTIDGVPRDLAERFAQYAESGKVAEPSMIEELRALLDTDECCHEFVPFQANCTKCGIPYKPAAQPQGEPVGIQIGTSLRGQSFIRNCQVTCCGSCPGGCTIGSKP